MPKPRVNGYLLYMQDMKIQVPHWNKKTIPEMMTLASPGWDALSQNEKDNYNRRAKEMRGVSCNQTAMGSARANGGGGVGGMDTHGRSLQSIHERDRKGKLEAVAKISAVDNHVEDKNGNLVDKVFFVMHATSFTKFTALSEGDEAITWVPAEIAVSKFSLSSGLIEAYQAFPLPGKLPVGSKFDCLQGSKKLDISLTPEDSSFNKKDVEIFKDLRAFLGTTDICFVMPELEDQVRGVVAEITQRSNQPSLGLSYLSLPRLLFKLRTDLCQTEEEVMTACPSDNVALTELEKGKFLYSGGLGCEHHEKEDTAKCCQTLLASWIFTILDICCPAFNIEMLPGTHAPNQVPLVKPVTWKADPSTKRSSGGLSLTVTEDGLFASQDVRYKKQSSTSSVSSGSSYQRYLDSGEDKDTDTMETASTLESSDQEGEEKNSDQEVERSPGSLEKRLSHISIRSSVQTDSSGVGGSDLSSLRRSIGRGTLLDRLRRSSTVKLGSIN